MYQPTPELLTTLGFTLHWENHWICAHPNGVSYRVRWNVSEEQPYLTLEYDRYTLFTGAPADLGDLWALFRMLAWPFTPELVEEALVEEALVEATTIQFPSSSTGLFRKSHY